MTETTRSPADLRAMFGANLRRLAQDYPSVSALCRELGINRTQFNRYLAGESFPRPDVLDRICRFFNVDARILLKPLDEIDPPLDHPAEALNWFMSHQNRASLPTGFFLLLEALSTVNEVSRSRLLFVRQIGGVTLVRGYEPRALAASASPHHRKVMGFVAGTKTHVCALITRKDARQGRMIVVSEQKGLDARIWVGKGFDLSAETGGDVRPQHVELHHIGTDLPTALRIARRAPYSDGSDFHLRFPPSSAPTSES